ncbi:protein mitoshell [Stomoxys calcitrans]|uniref:Bromo domain-containing protein n=1 Tax=Stomoxys calcitrans TaxID=35570 RepID=A0A1I8PY38_STOCA|nr:protein mitoshell [Stomoxys calcitrans]XP_013104508.1 protein mitoshell [Stomoxys calcitrans]XP_013104509.1 protein mitoshell [Stomoxys calcitrans]
MDHLRFPALGQGMHPSVTNGIPSFITMIPAITEPNTSPITISSSDSSPVAYHQNRMHSIQNQLSSANDITTNPTSHLQVLSNTLPLDFKAACGDTSNFQYDPTTTVNPSKAKLLELVRLALKGCSIAEGLAQEHRHRPCFKKIDCICARLKQDLMRPYGVLPNINSQGIHWGIKDFIFIFTRIVHAWIIAKGYVYDNSEGLNKVKSALSPDFLKSFVAWQDATITLIESLIKSFVNLDSLVQSHKNVNQKTAAQCTMDNNCSYSVFFSKENSSDQLSDSFDNTQCSSLNENNAPTMSGEMGEIERKTTTTYFKAGTYNLVKKDIFPVESAATISMEDTFHLQAVPCKQDIDKALLDFSITSYDGNVNPIVNVSPQALDSLRPKDIDCSNQTSKEEQNSNSLSNNNHLDTMGRTTESSNLRLTEKLTACLKSMKNADMFFKMHFSKNYFPDFINKHNQDFMDVRSIILKSEESGYRCIFEMVHDVKRIVFFGREFLKTKYDEKLECAINSFETEINEFLNKSPFANYQLEYLTGEPKELLYKNYCLI